MASLKAVLLARLLVSSGLEGFSAVGLPSCFVSPAPSLPCPIQFFQKKERKMNILLDDEDSRENSSDPRQKKAFSDLVFMKSVGLSA